MAIFLYSDSQTMKYKEAKLILKDGSEFIGKSFGFETETNGEVVFNTGMVGYPETLTDPSYRGQILVMTYPLIGNYGVPDKEKENDLLKYFESDNIHCRALIVSEYSENFSHWNAKRSLSDWLKEEKVPAIFGIDSRQLTRKLRESGTMPGKIIINNKKKIDFEDINDLDLVSQVSVKKHIEYKKGKTKIVLVDCGTKNNIIQAFLRRNISILRVPHNYDFTNEKVDGVIISNGPGNPKMCKETIRNVKKAIKKEFPLLGVCLGSQVIALSIGADTYKLKYGHRSHNQPCNELGTRKCYITSQNHGYAVNTDTLPLDWREWFINENDGTNEGIIHISKPFFAAQFHPEASPGPDDTEFIFDLFLRALK